MGVYHRLQSFSDQGEKLMAGKGPGNDDLLEEMSRNQSMFPRKTGDDIRVKAVRPVHEDRLHP